MNQAAIVVNETQPRWMQSLIGGVQVLIRPINREEAAAEREFITSLSSEAKRNRFLGHIGAPSDALIERMTHIDYRNDVALVAVTRVDGTDRIIGVSRYSIDSNDQRCECAVVVADDWQHKGLGTALMKHLIEIAQSVGIKRMQSFDYAENLAMRDLAHDLGFHVRPDPNDAHQVIYALDL